MEEYNCGRLALFHVSWVVDLAHPSFVFYFQMDRLEFEYRYMEYMEEKAMTETTWLRRFLCWLGFHEWLEGGLVQRDDQRRCVYCPKKQKRYPFAKVWGEE